MNAEDEKDIVNCVHCGQGRRWWMHRGGYVLGFKKQKYICPNCGSDPLDPEDKPEIPSRLRVWHG